MLLMLYIHIILKCVTGRIGMKKILINEDCWMYIRYVPLQFESMHLNH